MHKYCLLSEVLKPRSLYLRQQKTKKYENILKQDFSAYKPNQKWVTYISYIKINQSTLYLSMIKDLNDKFIVLMILGIHKITHLYIAP